MEDQRGRTPEGTDFELTLSGWTVHVHRTPDSRSESLRSIVLGLILGALGLGAICSGNVFLIVIGLGLIILTHTLIAIALGGETRFGCDGDHFFNSQDVWPFTMTKREPIAAIRSVRVIEREGKVRLCLGLANSNVTVAYTRDAEWIESLREVVTAALEYVGVDLDDAASKPLPPDIRQGERQCAIAKIHVGRELARVAQDLGTNPSIVKSWLQHHQNELLGVKITDQPGRKTVAQSWRTKLSPFHFLYAAAIAIMHSPLCRRRA